MKKSVQFLFYLLKLFSGACFEYIWSQEMLLQLQIPQVEVDTWAQVPADDGLLHSASGAGRTVHFQIVQIFSQEELEIASNVEICFSSSLFSSVEVLLYHVKTCKDHAVSCWTYNVTTVPKCAAEKRCRLTVLTVLDHDICEICWGWVPLVCECL